MIYPFAFIWLREAPIQVPSLKGTPQVSDLVAMDQR
jgi:hypothetical protein